MTRGAMHVSPKTDADAPLFLLVASEGDGDALHIVYAADDKPTVFEAAGDWLAAHPAGVVYAVESFAVCTRPPPPREVSDAPTKGFYVEETPSQTPSETPSRRGLMSFNPALFRLLFSTPPASPSDDDHPPPPSWACARCSRAHNRPPGHPVTHPDGVPCPNGPYARSHR